MHAGTRETIIQTYQPNYGNIDKQLLRGDHATSARAFSGKARILRADGAKNLATDIPGR